MEMPLLKSIHVYTYTFIHIHIIYIFIYYKHPKITTITLLIVYIVLHAHSIVSNIVTPCTVACQSPLSMEFFRQEYTGK